MNPGNISTNRIATLVTAFLFVVSGALSVPPAKADEGESAKAPAGSGVILQWSRAVEAKLAGIDAAAAPVAPAVGGGPSFKSGDTGGRVDRLAGQLTARGLLEASAYHGSYDEAVAGAVRAFQSAEGLPADGVAGDGTVAALDRTPAATVAALKATLTEMQALAAVAPKEFFLVNIPSQTAYLIRGDTVEMEMRVAVGRPSRPTPLLADRITDVILNPTWTAPTTVLAKDKLPSLRRTGSPGIEGATVYLDGAEVDPAAVDWSTVTPERLRVVQSPGNQNALGRFKFNLTNDQSIYMHDTNDHSVFGRQGRAISSGCVRLAEPRQLAEVLLGREGWTPERISKAVETKHTQGIGLSHPLPVRIVYWQASVDDGGVVHLHRDIYGRNAEGAIAQVSPVRTPAAAVQAKAQSAAVQSRAPHEVQVGEAVHGPVSPPVGAPMVTAALPAPSTVDSVTSAVVSAASAIVAAVAPATSATPPATPAVTGTPAVTAPPPATSPVVSAAVPPVPSGAAAPSRPAHAARVSQASSCNGYCGLELY